MSRSSLRAALGLAPVMVLVALGSGCGQRENKIAPAMTGSCNSPFGLDAGTESLSGVSLVLS